VTKLEQSLQMSSEYSRHERVTRRPARYDAYETQFVNTQSQRSIRNVRYVEAFRRHMGSVDLGSEPRRLNVTQFVVGATRYVFNSAGKEPL